MSERAVRPREETADVALHRAYAEIHLPNLGHNLEEIKKRIPSGCEVMAVVKADAYGHGAAAVAKYLQGSCGVNSFAVADLGEAVALRESGIRGEILILGYTDARHKRYLIRHRLTQTIVSEEHARSLCESPGTVMAHLKLDTGMNRLGERVGELSTLLRIYGNKRLRFTGIYSHLARADSLDVEDAAFTQTQIGLFFDTVRDLKERGVDVGCTHIQSSYGILNYPDLPCNVVRLGIALYGAVPRTARTRLDIPLRPVLSLKAAVSAVKEVRAGESVGYGHGFTAQRDLRIAVVGIGYADGIPRCLSGKGGQVLIRGRPAPIVGSICMDQLMVDVTGLPGVRQGDIATLIGSEGGLELPVDQISELGDTINNEILSRIGGRVDRLPAGEW